MLLLLTQPTLLLIIIKKKKKKKKSNHNIIIIKNKNCKNYYYYYYWIMEHNNGSQQTTASLPTCVKVVGDSHARTVAPPGRTNKHNESRTIDTRKDSIVRQFKGGFETRPSTIQECVESNPEGKNSF